MEVSDDEEDSPSSNAEPRTPAAPLYFLLFFSWPTVVAEVLAVGFVPAAEVLRNPLLTRNVASHLFMAIH